MANTSWQDDLKDANEATDNLTERAGLLDIKDIEEAYCLTMGAELANLPLPPPARLPPIQTCPLSPAAAGHVSEKRSRKVSFSNNATTIQIHSDRTVSIDEPPPVGRLHHKPTAAIPSIPSIAEQKPIQKGCEDIPQSQEPAKDAAAQNAKKRNALENLSSKMMIFLNLKAKKRNTLENLSSKMMIFLNLKKKMSQATKGS